MTDENLSPFFSKLIKRNDKENLHKQKSLSIWFIGLSGSGKTTLALQLEYHLFSLGFKTILLDGDNVRANLNKDLSFSLDDRQENIRRVAEINKILVENGLIVINSFVCPTELIRKMIVDIVGKENLIFVYVKASLETCIQRDVKGLYKKALNNEINQFTGISDVFEEPNSPDLIINTELYDKDYNLQEVVSAIIPKIKL